jgi:hypothetical protein
VDSHRSPADRVHAYIRGLFDFLTHPGAVGYAGVLVREHRRLAEVYPTELRTSLAPLIGMLAAELTAAAEAGTAAVDDPVRVANTIFVLLLSGVSDVALSQADPRETAEWLWEFCWSAVHGERVATTRKSNGGNR